MVFWICLGVVLLVGGIICAIIENRSYDCNIGLMCGAAGGFVLGGIALLAVLFARLGYVQFETKYEIQQEQYEMLMESNPDFDNIQQIYCVFDFMEINQELAEFQAARKRFGSFSIIPERVMEMTPIGLPGGE